MVCSFFHTETIGIVENFLAQNKNFSIQKYNPDGEFRSLKKLISREGFFFTLPTEYKKNYIDGFFSAQLIKND